MSNPVSAVTSTVTTPVSWAKAKPLAFAFMALVLIVVAIRYRAQIVSAIGKVPVVGTRLVGLMTA